MTRLLNIAFGLLLGGVLIGCGGEDSADSGSDDASAGEKVVITQKGSDTMVLLAQKWAEEYGKKNPGVQIQVTGGGSGTGIAALINGTTQIANASRSMKEKEIEQLKQKNGVEPVEIAVAKDGISIYLHPDNTLDEISLEQLKGIYEGTTTNWSELGGPNETIILYGRENSSGTYDFFKEHVLNKGDFASSTQTLAGTAGVVNAVANDPAGIGYGGAAYSSGIKVARILTESGESVEPSLENVMSGTYPLARDLYFYLPNEASGEIAAYIDWVLSDEGQRLTKEMEYFPVRSIDMSSESTDVQSESEEDSQADTAAE